MLTGPVARRAKFDTLPEMLRAAAESSSGIVFVDGKERERFHSWPELVARAERAAGRYEELGIQPQDRIALVLPTSVEFMDSYFGALLCGAVPVPLYPPLRLGLLDEYTASTARMLRSVGARVVISDSRIRNLLGRAVAEAKVEHGCLLASSLLGTERKKSVGAQVGRDPDALALIQFSSGSTVAPKAVALSHRSLLAQCAALCHVIAETNGPHPVGASWLPLYHDMGLIGCLLAAAYYPGKLVLLSPERFLARPALWLRALSRHKVTISPAPNFAYSLCEKRIRDDELDGVDLSAWCAALNGAETISAETCARFSRRFACVGFQARAMVPVYGLSEASLAVTFSPPGRGVRTSIKPDGRLEVVSVGAPLGGFAVDIRDGDRSLSVGETGRIWVRGPSLMKSYFGDLAESERALKEGWLDTGDLGWVADGELYVDGRAKDLVIVRGVNHSPDEFESCLHDLDGVRTGCTVALGYTSATVEDEQLLILAERARGFDASGDRATEERITKAVNARTGVRPHRVEMLAPGSLPRTSSGKLRRQEALSRFQCGQLSAPIRVRWLHLLLEAMRSWLSLLRLRWGWS